jgi:sulfur transfer complex TusBCD TusB component (DsrH family)
MTYTLHKLPQEGFIVTSDEQIKEGDSFYRNTGVISVMNKELSRYYESIKDLSAHNEYKLIAQQNQIYYDEVICKNRTTCFNIPNRLFIGNCK